MFVVCCLFFGVNLVVSQLMQIASTRFLFFCFCHLLCVANCLIVVTRSFAMVGLLLFGVVCLCVCRLFVHCCGLPLRVVCCLNVVGAVCLFCV